MTPKEKAKEIYCNYTDTLNIRDLQTTANPFAKKCALIVVDEIIKSREDDGHFDDSISYTGSEYYTEHPMYLTYWLQVKKEIEKL
jgi:hypothetical protein